MGVLGRMGGMALSAALTGAICLYFLNHFTKPNFSFKDFKKAIVIISPLVVASYAYIPIETMDRIVLERLKLPDEFGLYSIALQISGFYLIAATALFKAYEPDIFKSVIDKNKSNFFKNISQFLVIMSVGFIVFMFMQESMIALLTRGKFTEAVYYSRYLSLAKFVSSCGLLFGAIILAKQKVKESAYVIYAASVSSLLLYPLFVSLWGFDGALYARILVPTITIIISILIIKRLQNASRA